ncbi:MAG: polyprenyl synthetase family protein [Thermoleophilia bacterium]|nr:polyprenyl synthetase family protein [Thermoleophilia bacterium]
MITTAPIPGFVLSLRPWMDECEALLAEVVGGHAPSVTDPAIATLAAGGKRVRPMLVFCAASRRDDDRAALVSAAAAVELVHMATLVHDDLIDGATTRRGNPTVARAHGAAAAVNVGDFLFARAFAELAAAGSAPAVSALAAAALDLAVGEMDQQRASGDLALTVDAYMSRCRKKTGALFAVACRVGAMLSGSSHEAQVRLAAFGEHVGVAFQILDDILDLAGSPADTGKRRGTDILSGTVTLPVILAMAREPGLAADIAGVAAGHGDLEAMCNRLATHSGVIAARAVALDEVALAIQSLDEDIGGADADALQVIASGVVDRFA